MENTYRHLQGLYDSNFQIVEGEPNIIGWKVYSEAGAYLGQVKDLLFDSGSRAVRYIVMSLQDNGMNLGDKKMMVPIGIAELHADRDEITLPNVHQEQFDALPDYDQDNIGPDTEIYIRSVIGSPAALRIEEEIVQFDQDNFYTHQHFDKDRFYDRNRTTEQTTIHEMVERSKANDLHAAEGETGKNTHHNEQHEIKPWLQPGASHNQGADDNPENGNNDGYLDSNRPPYTN